MNSRLLFCLAEHSYFHCANRTVLWAPLQKETTQNARPLQVNAVVHSGRLVILLPRAQLVFCSHFRRKESPARQLTHFSLPIGYSATCFLHLHPTPS